MPKVRTKVIVKRQIALLLELILVGATALAQPVQMQVFLRSPAPGSLPLWASDPSIVQIILRNTTQTAYDGAIISFAIRRLPGGNVVVRSKDFHPLQPRLTVPASGTLVLTGPQIVHESAIKYEDESLRQQAQATGQLPEGEYEFCARLLDGQGREIGSTGALCPRTLVMLPDPPMLIHPRNDSMLAVGTMPMFMWAPVTGSAVPVTYTLRVVPLFPGQAPQDALNVNAPVLNLRGLVAPLYQYVPTDLPFTAFPQAIGFVWQVAAVDANGLPAARNNGKSEIFRFRFAPSEGRSSAQDTLRTQSTPGESAAAAQSSSSPPSRGEVIRRILLPDGFVVRVKQPQRCEDARCPLRGSGMLYVPLLADSLELSLEGITVSRPDGNGDATLIEGELWAPLRWSRSFGLLTLTLSQLTATPVHVSVDGTWTVQWSQWGWSCGIIDSVVFHRQRLYPAGIEKQSLRLAVPWRCSGEQLLVGDCIEELRLETLETKVEVDTLSQEAPTVSAHLIASGSITMPCITTNGLPARGTVQLHLDQGREGLFASGRVPLREALVQGMSHIRLTADSLVLDLSDRANLPGFPPVQLCGHRAWTAPQWRGIVIPSAQVGVVVDNHPYSLQGVLPVVIEQGQPHQFKLSIAGNFQNGAPIQVGGFSVVTDSAEIAVCQGVLQRLSAKGVLRVPGGLAQQPSFRALDSIPVRLTGYDDGNRWRWNATVNLPSEEISLGGTVFYAVVADAPRIETVDPPVGQRQGYIEFERVIVHVPASPPHQDALFEGLRLWNTGEIELSPRAQVSTGADRISIGSAEREGTSTESRVSLQWLSPLRLPYTLSDPHLTLPVGIENGGGESVSAWTQFALSVGVYVELPDRQRQYMVEHRRYTLPQVLRSRGRLPLDVSVLLPQGSRVLGVRIALQPLDSLGGSQSGGSSVLVQGELPPLGEVQR
ncbi:MAG: hypothetical protein RMK00_05000 [Bacteroidota bacterium]|nr:hypothetical protein [Bacteroidota bacterium]